MPCYAVQMRDSCRVVFNIGLGYLVGNSCILSNITVAMSGRSSNYLSFLEGYWRLHQ